MDLMFYGSQWRKITRQEEGIVPFNVPAAAAAAHVAVFENMPNVLLAAGPLVKGGCYTLFLAHHKRKLLTRRREK